MELRRFPAERTVSFGFEDVVAENTPWNEHRAALAEANVNGVSLSVGRTDWTAFPWPAHDGAADAVQQTGRDFVAEAIDQVREDRMLTLIIDTLAPGRIDQNPSLAGVNAAGETSDLFPSVSALVEGEAGDLIVALAAEISERYRPDRLSLTELMFDHHSFGDDDLRSYRQFTREPDWPRDVDGRIESGAPELATWRSTMLSRLLSRVKDAAAEYGTKLDMDVRAPWSDPTGDRSESGHNYELLLEYADRLVIWNYFAINDSSAEYGAEITRSLRDRFPGRFVMSTGLWAKDGAITPDQLRLSLEAVAGAGAEAVAVTPVSMLTGEHWRKLEQLWS